MVTKTYLPSYICDSSGISDSSDSSYSGDSSDSSDNIDSSDSSDSSDQKTFFSHKFFSTKNCLNQKLLSQKYLNINALETSLFMPDPFGWLFSLNLDYFRPYKNQDEPG